MCRSTILHFAVIALAGCLAATRATAVDDPVVDLLFDPVTPMASVDDIVEIDLLAHSSDGSQQTIVEIDAILIPS